MTSDQGDSFNASRAEVFEALGHPTRIRILQTLGEKPLGYADLKRGTGIESNGLLAFHLGKLAGLVRQNAEGDYALTDEGREALRITEASKGIKEAPKTTMSVRTPRQKAILAGLIIGLIVLGSIAIYQQEQINPSSRTGDPNSMVLVYGTIGFNDSWATGIQGTFHLSQIEFAPVTSFASAASDTPAFTVTPDATGQYWVLLPAGQSYKTTVSYVGSGTCQNCSSIIDAPPTLAIGNVTATQCPVSGCPKPPPDQLETLEFQVQVHGPGLGNSVTASGTCYSGSWELYSNSTTFYYSPTC